MVVIDLGKIGTVDVSKKLVCNLNISSKALFGKYPKLVEDLSQEGIEIIKESVDKNREVKTKNSENEIRTFFEKFKSFSGTLGFGEDEEKEMEESEELEKEQMDKGEYEYKSKDTYDRKTGKKEGEIKLGSEGNKGKLVPLVINESLEMALNHEGEVLEKSKPKLTGTLTIENASTKDRLWDLDLFLKDIDKTDIKESTINIRELAAGSKSEQAYKVSAEAKPSIEIKEVISTLNDPNVESYALVLNADNDIYCGIQLKNIADKPLTNVVISKHIPEEFSDVKIGKSSVGSTDIEDVDGKRSAVWKIEEFKAGAEAKLDLTLRVKVEDVKTKVRTGEIAVKYTAPFSISGVGIDRFNAYTNNNFYIIENEKDEVPDKYDCQFVFENKSEFMVRLTNADVYDQDDKNKKYIDIDPNEVPPLAAGAKWLSNWWEYQAAEGAQPIFKNKVEFFVIADHQISSAGALSLSDVALAVAAIEGELKYNISNLASFKVTPFEVEQTVINTGGADLNEVTLTEIIQKGYKPPTPDKVSVMLNGEEIEVSEGVVSIVPSDDDSGHEHKVIVKLANLKDQPVEKFGPKDKITVIYPIIADKPAKDTKFVSNVVYTANTYPAGKPLQVVMDPIEIAVSHIRKKFYKGKDIAALSKEGQYEITLYVVNAGEFPMENYEVIDKVPEQFEYYDESEKPEVTQMEGMDCLKWVIKKIEPGQRVEIKYKLKGEGKPSNAQETY